MRRDLPGTDLTAIVLAAGESRRMGAPKMALPFGQSTVLGTTLSHILEGGFSRVVVVLGPGTTLERLTGEPLLRRDQVTVVTNPEPSQGMLSSAQIGAAAMTPGVDFAIALGDQPTISGSTIHGLLQTFVKEQPEVLRPRWGGKRGHPVFFRAPLRRSLLDLPVGATLRDLVYAFPALEVDVATDEIHRDIDTPEEYALELARTGGLLSLERPEL